MDNIVTIEYRGISGDLAVGDCVTVESVEAGVLRLRAAPAEPKTPSAAAATSAASSDDSATLSTAVDS